MNILELRQASPADEGGICNALRLRQCTARLCSVKACLSQRAVVFAHEEAAMLKLRHQTRIGPLVRL